MLGLYERILEQTSRLDITGKQLGELLGLKKSPLTDWKNCKSNPTLEQLAKMCEIFAVSSDYLLFGSETNLSADQQELFNAYSSLSDDDQEEILEFIDFKLKRAQRKK